MNERRAHPRQGVAPPYAVRLLSPQGHLVGMAVPEDISAGGIRLLVSRPQPVGGLLKLAPDAPSLAGRVFAFRVSRCQPLAGGGHELAGPFVNLLPATEVQAVSAS